MTYVYIHIPLLSTEPFLHSSREQLGTWLALYAYCAEQENSGRIRNARNWAPATWNKILGTDTPGDCPLWLWHGNDLVLHGYSKENQSLAQRKRAGAKEGAKRRWKDHPENATGIPTGNASPNAKRKESKRSTRDSLESTRLPRPMPDGQPPPMTVRQKRDMGVRE